MQNTENLLSYRDELHKKILQLEELIKETRKHLIEAEKQNQAKNISRLFEDLEALLEETHALREAFSKVFRNDLF